MYTHNRSLIDRIRHRAQRCTVLRIRSHHLRHSPTDPAALLSPYPLATQLVQYLPPSPVLSVLETAVPAGFVSSVVHDPSFAASFEQAFASGSPPSWFTALPSDVQGYLHTWQVGGLASEVGSVEAGLGAATGSLPHSIIGANATSGSARFGPLVTGASGSGSESGMVTAPSTTGGVTSASGTVLSGTNTPASSSVAAQSAAAASSGASTAAAPSSSNAGAPHQTGLLATGMAAAVGAVFVIAL